ncbi:amidase [Vibrio eleionomae]|nr:amidase [Vibrio eleionomae]
MMSKDTRIFCQQGPDGLAPTQEGALSGYAFVFKDLFDVAGYTTGAGNPTWLQTHEPATHTSPLIDRLLAQGAECVGRVQTDELAYSLNGQNIHYGTPINPAAPDCIPGGSSSGSAVSVSGGVSDFAIGTDTGGSVRVPASYNNIYGFRPTLGKLDLSCAFELAKSFDTAGILAINLPLLRQVFKVLCDNPTEGKTIQNVYLDDAFVPFLSPERLAQLTTWCAEHDITLDRGHLLQDSDYDFAQLSLIFRTVQGYEIIQKHGDWLSQYGDQIDPAILARVEWSRTITKTMYDHACYDQSLFTKWIAEFGPSKKALWVLPTTPGRPPQLTMESSALAKYRSELMGMTALAGLAGLPQLHLPMAELDEGPCGVSLLGYKHGDMDVLATAMRLIGEVDDAN